jgi:hypothetical protein
MMKSIRAWGTLHPSVFRHAASLTRWVAASARPHGALRYRCPVTRSFVVVTDDETLAGLDRPRARLRCPTCGEMHLLTREAQERVAAIAAASLLDVGCEPDRQWPATGPHGP